jgi:hypothetical protein
MKVGDEVEIWRDGVRLGHAHIAETFESGLVNVKATRRVLPSRKASFPVDRFEPLGGGRWRLELVFLERKPRWMPSSTPDRGS